MKFVTAHVPGWHHRAADQWHGVREIRLHGERRARRWRALPCSRCSHILSPDITLTCAEDIPLHRTVPNLAHKTPRHRRLAAHWARSGRVRLSLRRGVLRAPAAREYAVAAVQGCRVLQTLCACGRVRLRAPRCVCLLRSPHVKRGGCQRLARVWTVSGNGCGRVQSTLVRDCTM